MGFVLDPGIWPRIQLHSVHILRTWIRLDSKVKGRFIYLFIFDGEISRQRSAGPVAWLLLTASIQAVVTESNKEKRKVWETLQLAKGRE